MIPEKRYRLPAEWEPQSGVQLTWPHRNTDWAPMLGDVLVVYRQMAFEISRRERLLIVAPDTVKSSEFSVHSPEQPAMDYAICRMNTNDTWARDHGFLTLSGVQGSYLSDFSIASKSESTLGLRLLDFRFNGWGEKFPSDLDNAINSRLYDSGAVCGEYVSHLDFVLEGGSIESDGRGTIFTTSSCLLAPHRNEPLTKDEIEERLKEWLCADRVLWIDHGQLAGDDTDGHIDTLVRIAPDDTLLYVSCDDPADEHFASLQLMEEQLHTFRTKEGRPYRLLPLPLPHPIFSSDFADGSDESHRLPATYANFLIVNGAVLCPVYGQADRDTEALAVIARAFPDRDIVPIDCRPLIRQHGSLHCCTMQFPKGVLPATDHKNN